ncbi:MULTISPECIES: alpha/beta fold hydrolase [Lactiplantibacillus]|nr:alpha/beta hydrolase [Lactiplantibacillus plantarum]MDN7072457.1 alpha/beta hydrolase [Lactiplantibacillus plantarum]
MGASEIPHTLYSADKLVEQLNNFSHAISSKRVILVGHSYGGYLALELMS